MTLIHDTCQPWEVELARLNKMLKMKQDDWIEACKEVDELKKQNQELQEYKTMWQSIAGKANLQELIKRLEDAEEV